MSDNLDIVAAVALIVGLILGVLAGLNNGPDLPWWRDLINGAVGFFIGIIAVAALFGALGGDY